MYGAVTQPPRGEDSEEPWHARPREIASWRRPVALAAACGLAVLAVAAVYQKRTVGEDGAFVVGGSGQVPMEESAWPAKPEPFSIVDPEELGFKLAVRQPATSPGRIFGDVQAGAAIGAPLPTNAWYQNLLMQQNDGRFNGIENKAYSIPYVVDTACKDVGAPRDEDTPNEAGTIANGLRVHYPRLLSGATIIQLSYDEAAGLMLGAADPVREQLVAPAFPPTELSLTLEWSGKTHAGSVMRAPIVRGMAYVTMEYEMLRPQVSAQMLPAGPPLVDGETKLHCTTETSVGGRGEKDKSHTVVAESYISVHFINSDFTWLIFVSEPVEVFCAQSGPTDPHQFFLLETTELLRAGTVRVALENNCTTGINMGYCMPDAFGSGGRDQSANRKLLLKHRHMYPTGLAGVEFTFPVRDTETEDLTMAFDWNARHTSHSRDAEYQSSSWAESQGMGTLDDAIEPLMYALPHHMDDMIWTVGSSNAVSKVGCARSIHGYTCPVSGGRWTMRNVVQSVSFAAPRAPRKEMRDAILEALETDIDYDVDDNFARGAGDTYFGGKQLAKLGRIIIIADEVGFDRKRIQAAADRLAIRAQVWLNGSAEGPLIYDKYWGGVVSCGCDFDEETRHCRNSYPNCPALNDPGQNFGHGFYNDHHFHFGYHIYAAAVASRFNPEWGKKHFEHVMAIIRDIANPSDDDHFFHIWRHKDWFLGSSWASGIASVQGHPYANGRNQESSSEAVAAYEAVALYGGTMAEIFGGATWGLTDLAPDTINATKAQRIRELGRLLLSTELRSAKRYWHVVKGRYEKDYDQIYPDIYEPHAVGMLWSTMAQFQTWFGSAPFLVYGIQMVPSTPTMELLLEPLWLKGLLPDYKSSCEGSEMCVEQGWEILYHLANAAVGNWTEAWEGLDNTPVEAYTSAGGNGHSRTNSLHWVATRPELANMS